MTRIRTPLLVLALATLATACSGADFEPISRLDKLRVLALRNVPVNPVQGESTAFEPLVYTPPELTAASTFEWSWCPLLGNAADGYTCPVTDADVAALATQLGATEAPPPLVFSTDEKPSYKNVFPSAALAAFCANGFGEFKPDCENGFPIRIVVKVRNAGQEVVATAVVRLPIDATPSNLNPVIDGLEAELSDAAAQPIDEAGTVVLPRLYAAVIRAKLDVAQSEAFMGTDDDGNPATVKERLVLSWYSEQGDIDSIQTAYIDGKSAFDRLTDNKLEPKTKEDDPADKSRVIVVLRDNRGGVSWTTGVVTLGAQP